MGQIPPRYSIRSFHARLDGALPVDIVSTEDLEGEIESLKEKRRLTHMLCSWCFMYMNSSLCISIFLSFLSVFISAMFVNAVVVLSITVFLYLVVFRRIIRRMRVALEHLDRSISARQQVITTIRPRFPVPAR